MVRLALLAALLAPRASAADDAETREHMVKTTIAAPTDGRRAVTDPRVLDAMRSVERHLFVPRSLRDHAYGDSPLPIGEGQTISQPYIVALMTDLLDTEPGDTVLEVGTGSGYQAAILSKLVERVFTIEIVEPLASRARRTLAATGCTNVEVRHGDGYAGWPEHAPFDAIIVTAAPEQVPAPLIEQLAVGGRLVIPVGPQDDGQKLIVLHKRPDGTVDRTEVTSVRFVPFTRDR